MYCLSTHDENTDTAFISTAELFLNLSLFSFLLASLSFLNRVSPVVQAGFKLWIPLPQLLSAGIAGFPFSGPQGTYVFFHCCVTHPQGS